MDDKKYLQPNFDPKQLKVPQLRSILLEHDIDYPSSAKKADLINLFNAHIAPNSEKFLKEHDSINPSGNGIVDAKSSQDKASEDRKGSIPVRTRTRRKRVEDPEGKDTQDKKSTRSKSPAKRDDSPKRRSRRIATNEKAVSESAKATSTESENDSDLKENSTSRSNTPLERESTPQPTSSTPVDGASTPKGTEIPEDTPFSKRNVFQSPPQSIPKKRSSKHKENTPMKKVKNSTKSFPSHDLTNKLTNKTVVSLANETKEKTEISSPGKNFIPDVSNKKGSLFDDDDTSTVEDFFKMKNEKLTKKSPSPDKKTQDQSFKVKKETKETKKKRKKELETKLVKVSEQNENTEPSYDDRLETHENKLVKEEEEAMDKRKSIMPSLSQLKMSREFASQLGVTIQGLPEPNMVFSDSKGDAAKIDKGDISFAKTPKRSSKVGTPMKQTQNMSSPTRNFSRSSVKLAKLTDRDLTMQTPGWAKSSPDISVYKSPETLFVSTDDEEDEFESDSTIEPEFHSFADMKNESELIGVNGNRKATFYRSMKGLTSETSTKEESSDVNSTDVGIGEVEEEEEEDDEEEEAKEDSTVEESSFKINTPELTDDDTDLKKLQSDMDAQHVELEKESSDILNQINSPSVSLFTILKYILAWFSILAVVLGVYWYREQRILVGYCGVEIYQPTFSSDYDLPLWILKGSKYLDDNLRPSCIPCPSHARCFPYSKLGCFDDFIEAEPWYNIGGLIPGSSFCIPDTRKAERIELMIDYSLDLLRSRNAGVLCGEGGDSEAGLSISELHDYLFEVKAPYITNEEFEELWERSLVELEKEPEITVRHVYFSSSPPQQITNIQQKRTSTNLLSTSSEIDNERQKDKNKILRSSSVANLDLKCQIQRAVHGKLSRHKYKLLVLILSIVIFQVSKYKYIKQCEFRSRIEALNVLVFEKLKKQYQLAVADTTKETRKYIGSNQLRDLLLFEENSYVKLKIWEKVAKRVESDTNVGVELTEVHGEIMKVWEWIGSDA